MTCPICWVCQVTLIIINLFMRFVIFVWKLIVHEKFFPFLPQVKVHCYSNNFFFWCDDFKINMELQKIKKSQNSLKEQQEVGKTLPKNLKIWLIWGKINTLKTLSLLIYCYWVSHILTSYKKYCSYSFLHRSFITFILDIWHCYAIEKGVFLRFYFLGNTKDSE